jgi:hypothetical protein
MKQAQWFVNIRRTRKTCAIMSIVGLLIGFAVMALAMVVIKRGDDNVGTAMFLFGLMTMIVMPVMLGRISSNASLCPHCHQHLWSYTNFCPWCGTPRTDPKHTRCGVCGGRQFYRHHGGGPPESTMVCCSNCGYSVLEPAA